MNNYKRYCSDRTCAMWQWDGFHKFMRSIDRIISIINTPVCKVFCGVRAKHRQCRSIWVMGNHVSSRDGHNEQKSERERRNGLRLNEGATKHLTDRHVMITALDQRTHQGKRFMIESGSR